MDNIFIERLWRSIKYEEVHLKAYADGREARDGIGSWMSFYNHRRPHQPWFEKQLSMISGGSTLAERHPLRAQSLARAHPIPRRRAPRA